MPPKDLFGPVPLWARPREAPSGEPEGWAVRGPQTKKSGSPKGGPKFRALFHSPAFLLGKSSRGIVIADQSVRFGFSGVNLSESTRRPPREESKNENCGGEVKKSAKFWAVPRRGVRWRGGPA